MHSRIEEFNESLTLNEAFQVVSAYFWRPSDAFPEETLLKQAFGKSLTKETLLGKVSSKFVIPFVGAPVESVCAFNGFGRL